MVFTQALNEMCLDTEIISLCKHFVLHGTSLLFFIGQRPAIEDCNPKGKIWKDIAFPKIMKSYHNNVLSGENAVVTVDVFHYYLRQAIKNPDDMDSWLSKNSSTPSINYMMISMQSLKSLLAIGK